MERFVVQITETPFKVELETILQHKKPFQNFKHVIENSDYRQEWFDFKQKELEKRVAYQLNS